MSWIPLTNPKRPGPDPQTYYKKIAREIHTILKCDINYRCKNCGYLLLNPTNRFERLNGGVCVKRSRVTIIDDKTNKEVIRLKLNEDQITWGCNACVNDWK